MIVINPKKLLTSALVITSFMASQVHWPLSAQVSLLPAFFTVLLIVGSSIKKQRIYYVALKSLAVILFCLVLGLIFSDADKASEALLVLYTVLGIFLVKTVGAKKTSWLFKLLALLAVIAQIIQALLPSAERIFFIRDAMDDASRGFSGFFSEPSFMAAVLFVLWLAVNVLRPKGAEYDWRFSFLVLMGLALTGSITGGVYCAIIVVGMVRLNRKQLQLLAAAVVSIILLAQLETGPLRIFNTAEIIQDPSRDQSANARYLYFQKDFTYSFRNFLLPAVSYEAAFRNSEWADFGLEQPMNYSTITPSSIFGYFLVTYGFLTPVAFVACLTYLSRHLTRTANRARAPVLAGLVLLSCQMVSLGLYPIGMCLGAIYGVCRYPLKD